MTRRTSRRALFGSAALLATLPAFARPDGPDHELIAVCGAFIADCERYEALEASGMDAVDGKRQAATIWSAWDHQVARMDVLRARTADGLQARALALHHLVRGGMPACTRQRWQGECSSSCCGMQLHWAVLYERGRQGDGGGWADARLPLGRDRGVTS